MILSSQLICICVVELFSNSGPIEVAVNAIKRDIHITHKGIEQMKMFLCLD